MIWGIVLPATARLPLGGLPASLNTAVNALRHVGARGCRRDVQGQEVGAPSSLGAFRGLSGGCGWVSWDTALSTWLAVQVLGGSKAWRGLSSLPHAYVHCQTTLPPTRGSTGATLCCQMVRRVVCWKGATSPFLGVCSVLLRKPRLMWPPCYCGNLWSWLMPRRCLSGVL